MPRLQSNAAGALTTDLRAMLPLLLLLLLPLAPASERVRRGQAAPRCTPLLAQRAKDVTSGERVAWRPDVKDDAGVAAGVTRCRLPSSLALAQWPSDTWEDWGAALVSSLVSLWAVAWAACAVAASSGLDVMTVTAMVFACSSSSSLVSSLVLL
jgi:hypothetical protein